MLIKRVWDMQLNMQQPTEATYTAITEYMNVFQIRLEVIIQENMQKHLQL